MPTTSQQLFIIDALGPFFQGMLGEAFVKGVRRTSLLTLFNYGMVYLFGFSLALLMYEIRSGIKDLFFAIIYLPWIVSGIGCIMTFLKSSIEPHNKERLTKSLGELS